MSRSTPVPDDPEGQDAPTTGDQLREARVALDDADFETMGIGDLVSLLAEAGFRSFEAMSCHEDGAVVQVTLDRPLDDDRLAALDCTDWWTRVSDDRTGQRYVIEFTARGFPSSVVERAEDLISMCNPELTEDGITVSLVGAQAAIAEVISQYETAGMTPDLQRLGVYEGREDRLAPLTDRQREVLETAYDMGYFDVPRAVSIEEIAAELGIDTSTTAEHLQRAERNFLSQNLPGAGRRTRDGNRCSEPSNRRCRR